MTEWLLGLPLNGWIQATVWAWPAFETLHFFGLSLLLGGLLVTDLRLMGLYQGFSLEATNSVLPWVVIGFLINLVTGVLFVIGDPERYLIHTGFQLKMVLIGLAGLNVVWFYLRVVPLLHVWPDRESTTMEMKAIGGISLILWFTILVLGRLIPYVSTG